MTPNLLEISQKYRIPSRLLLRAYFRGEIARHKALVTTEDIEAWILTRGIIRFNTQGIA